MDGQYATLRSRLSCLSVVRDGAIAWDRVAWWMVALVGTLYLASISGSWWPTPDSALYLMLSDNLLAGKGYTLWGQPHIHVPPGFPLILAALKGIGLGNMWCLNTCMIAMALATLWVCYKTLCEMTSREMAMVLTGALACAHAFHFESVRVLSDVPGMLLAWIGIYCYLRGSTRKGVWLEVGTVALFASCTVRAAEIPLAAGAALGLMFQADPAFRRRAIINATAMLAVFATAAAVGLAFFCFQATTPTNTLPQYGDFVGRALMRSAWELVWAPLYNFLRTSPSLLELLNGQRHEALGLFAAVAWIPVAAGMVAHARRRQWIAIGAVLGYCGAILMQTCMILRYLLPVAPLLMLYFCEGIAWIVASSASFRRHRAQVALICASLLWATNFPKTAGVTFCIHCPQASWLGSERDSLYDAADYLRQAAGPGERFISSDYARMLSYLSEVPSIPLRSGAAQQYGKADFDRWVRDGVVFAVIPMHEQSPSSRQRLNNFIKALRLQKVYANDNYRIFKLRSYADIACSRRLNSAAPRDEALHDSPVVDAVPPRSAMRPNDAASMPSK